MNSLYEATSKLEPSCKQRLNDLLLGVGLDRVVALNARQVLFERPVVLPQDLVVDDEQRRAVLLHKAKELFVTVQEHFSYVIETQIRCQMPDI